MDASYDQVSIRKGRFLREQVYKKLKASILNQTLPQNKRLVEEKLAEELGTSRTPVREAIQKLEKEGLIHKLSKGGYAVSAVTDEDIEEIFGIRGILEGYAAYLATTRVTDEDIKFLEEIVDRAEQCLKRGDVDECVRLNTEFHDRLYRIAKSAKLYGIINDLRDYIYRYRIIILRYEGMVEVSIKDHREMIVLMKSKRAGKVERLVRKHITRGKTIVKKKIKQEVLKHGTGKKGSSRG
jgi:DNA-binding GntR family transcriptional regulator